MKAGPVRRLSSDKHKHNCPVFLENSRTDSEIKAYQLKRVKSRSEKYSNSTQKTHLSVIEVGDVFEAA